MDLVIDGLLAFSAILVAFGVIAIFTAVVELAHRAWERRQRDRELLPEPNPRAVVRRRGWRVPM